MTEPTPDPTLCRNTKPASFDYCHLDTGHPGPHRGAIGAQWPNTPDFELPTVGALREQVDQLTRERDQARSDADALQRRLNDWDQRLRQTTRERDSLARRLGIRFEQIQALDQMRATVVGRLDRLRTAADNLIDALDEGDIDTIGRIERLREALHETRGEREDDTRMELTEAAIELLETTPSSGDTTSVVRNTREGDQDFSGGPGGTHSLHKSDYPMPESEENSLPERYMMATIAHHKLGDLSRPEPNLASITGEDDEHWIGSWVEGGGFIGVRFPKTSTRELTPEETKEYDGRVVAVGTQLQGYVIRIPMDVEDGTQ
ncbi:hypothetical protein Ait01nite_030360 [Actinoplanes italicus]|uniref:Uncharacterized protein n=1 Tax=Actinoplanes italicus TaxID=113567 RepID=A0A2T0KIZ5_9ACTN|nr:hypothetical protein [Actinoplanes italicus]PRX23495.1 hypothetical protein CLV67_103243 [Actinoplanes italicus]GIE29991.1 hypothetical protein Ait01nite_030360 [Actinoplanes italicus]